MKTFESEKRILEFAKDVLNLSRNTLVVNLRFMDAALSQFTCYSDKGLLVKQASKYGYINSGNIKHLLKWARDNCEYSSPKALKELELQATKL